MKEQMLNEVVARRFLLGQLSPDEQGRIEELAFDDPHSFEVLQAAEDDLIDEFVYDDLSAEERERFQEHYLAQPGRREDVRIASALRKYFDREQPVPTLSERMRNWIHISGPRLVPVMAKAAAIVAAAVIGLVMLIPRIMGPLPQVAQQQPSPLPSPLPSPTSTASETPPQPSPSPAPSQTKPPSPYRPPAPVYAVLLTPGSVGRGASEVTKVSLTSKAKSLDLLLIDSASYRSYRATLDEDGTTLKTWSNLKPAKISSHRGFRIPIPFEKLKASQRYHIVLQGVGANGNLELVHEYDFDATN